MNVKFRKTDSEKIETNHPDNAWLTKIAGWKLAGTLSFANRKLEVQHNLVKNLFGLYNYHLNEECDWKNVPVYFRWEFSDNERLHCHFILLGYTPDFYWLRGGSNVFANGDELASWFARNWRHGTSHYTANPDSGWAEYITKENSLMDSCFSPPIHFLKRRVLAGGAGFFNPRFNLENYSGGRWCS